MKNKTDSQRYFESFIEEVKDYTFFSLVEFFVKYCCSYSEQEDIKKDYESYSKYEMQRDELDYEEWLEQVYFIENEDEVRRIVDQYREPKLDCVVYKDINNNSDYKIYEVTLSIGWPNVFVILHSRWNRVEYQFYWWWEKFEADLSYMYDEIFNYLNLDYYE